VHEGMDKLHAILVGAHSIRAHDQARETISSFLDGVPFAKLVRRSRHGAPVRATHNTPSTSRRLSSPLRPGSPIFPGNSGAIRSHWALLNTVRIKADLPFPALNQSFRAA
jgi:hypothetical protein